MWHIKSEFEYLLDKKAKSGTPGPESSVKKRKLSAVDDEMLESTPGASAAKKRKADGSPNDPPAKAKRAFLFFVKARRHEAEKELGPDASVSVGGEMFHAFSFNFCNFVLDRRIKGTRPFEVARPS